MSRRIIFVCLVLSFTGHLFGQGLIFEDDFEWGSTCAWSNDLWFVDGDIDFFGDQNGAGLLADCPGLAGRVDNNRDCDDQDPLINPSAIEICDDSKDNDCDGLTDCDDSDCFDDPDCQPPFPRINEIRYDNDSSDDFEFIELYLEGGDVDLGGYTLVHFNGAGGAVIWELPLDSVWLPSDGFLVIGDMAVDELDLDWSAYGIGSLQNSEESLVLYWDWGGPDQVVKDAVGWGDSGTFFMGEGSPAPEIEWSSWNNSIGRYPDGTDTNDNFTDFSQSWWSTPGSPNTPAQPAGYTRITFSSSGLTPLPTAIPDANPIGIELDAAGLSFLPTVIADLHVGVRIRHSSIGDLSVTISSPVGTTAVLHDQTGGSDDDLMTVYDLATSPVTSLDIFNGENPQGDFWTFHVSDNAAGDLGDVMECVIWVLGP